MFDKELGRTQGVVVRRAGDKSYISVEFEEPPIVVDFLPDLFPDVSLTEFGTAVDCIMCEKPDGSRYQTFERSKEVRDNLLVRELISMLTGIDEDN